MRKFGLNAAAILGGLLTGYVLFQIAAQIVIRNMADIPVAWLGIASFLFPVAGAVVALIILNKEGSLAPVDRQDEGQDREHRQKGKTPRIVYFVMACLTLGSIVAQTVLAGLALFNDPVHWHHHSMFVKMFTYLPLMMFIVALIGSMSGMSRWGGLVLFLLIYAQYATANLAVIGALHPVIALFLFGVSVATVRRGFAEMTRAHSS